MNNQAITRYIYDITKRIQEKDDYEYFNDELAKEIISDVSLMRTLSNVMTQKMNKTRHLVLNLNGTKFENMLLSMLGAVIQNNTGCHVHMDFSALEDATNVSVLSFEADHTYDEFILKGDAAKVAWSGVLVLFKNPLKTYTHNTKALVDLYF